MAKKMFKKFNRNFFMMKKLFFTNVSFCPYICPSVHLCVLLSIHMSFCPSISFWLIYAAGLCLLCQITLSNVFVKWLSTRLGCPKGKKKAGRRPAFLRVIIIVYVIHLFNPNERINKFIYLYIILRVRKDFKKCLFM